MDAFEFKPKKGGKRKQGPKGKGSNRHEREFMDFINELEKMGEFDDFNEYEERRAKFKKGGGSDDEWEDVDSDEEWEDVE